MKILSLCGSAILVAFASASAQEIPQRTANDGQIVMTGIPEIPATIGERLGAYQNVRVAAFADWTQDGKSVYISTRFGSTRQLHRVDMPGGARHQITFTAEPVDSAIRRPGGKELLYAMDVGGGEFDQLYLLDPETGRSRRLTDGSSRNSNVTWSRDGRRIAYTSTRRDGRSNDIWVMDVADTASAKLVLQAPDGTLWGATDWSRDGSRLLVYNFLSIEDSRLHIVDVATGRMTRVAGGTDRKGRYTGITSVFDETGEGILFATDGEGEFLSLVHMVLATGEWHRLSGDQKWDVEGFAQSDDGKRGAYWVNEGGVSKVYLMDLSGHSIAPATGIPDGVIAGMKYSPDGRRLAVSMQTAVSPNDVFTLELGDTPTRSGAFARWTFSEVGGLNPASFVNAELVDYRSFDGRTIPAFIHKPRAAGPHPVVIVIHGGPEAQSRPTFSSTVQSWVVELGVAVILPNVRGSTGYGKTFLGLDNATLRENSVKDIGALLDWIATQPDLDRNRVMVYGGSYGGYMVLASLVHYSDRLRGGVDIVGISDWTTFLQNTEDYRRDLRRAEYGDERNPTIRAYFDQISPKGRSGQIRAPLFVIQGQNDPRVPFTEAEQIVSAVRSNGRPVWYMKALNEGHGFVRKENTDLMRDAVAYFFEQHLLRR